MSAYDLERIRDLSEEARDFYMPLCVPESTREAQAADYGLQLCDALDTLLNAIPPMQTQTSADDYGGRAPGMVGYREPKP